MHIIQILDLDEVGILTADLYQIPNNLKIS